MGTALLEGVATRRRGREEDGEVEKKEGETGPEERPGAWQTLELRLWDSLMKADTGRILRQRFCFLMAIVSCRNEDKGEEGRLGLKS